MDFDKFFAQSNISDETPSPQHVLSEVNENYSETPRPRQRAFLACIECRMRKRRCDVSQGGKPCTVCRENGRTCAVRRRQRKQDKPLLTQEAVPEGGPSPSPSPSSSGNASVKQASEASHLDHNIIVDSGSARYSAEDVPLFANSLGMGLALTYFRLC
jgi:hypothetical protein